MVLAAPGWALVRVSRAPFLQFHAPGGPFGACEGRTVVECVPHRVGQLVQAAHVASMKSFADESGGVVGQEEEGGVEDVLAQFGRPLQGFVAAGQVGDDRGRVTLG
ncbi:hypothetical protein ACFU96_48050 [Streptomyces sp. NPDC057620]|uniref:hypothetical protein n=1 Tax=Streptomyces sp. NPDC057620 TaxID=3346185 RepID=UPI00368AD9EA